MLQSCSKVLVPTEGRNPRLRPSVFYQLNLLNYPAEKKGTMLQVRDIHFVNTSKKFE